MAPMKRDTESDIYFNNKVPGSYTLSDREYAHLCDTIYASSGISLGDNKKELVHARLSKILRKRQISSFREYIDILVADDTGSELVDLMDAISTNVTHFFREEQHFAFLAKMIHAEKRYRNLRIWSAGCSSGEEPYTIAITLAEHVLDDCITAPAIIATDLSTKVLKRAVSGVYNTKAIENLEPALVRRHFLKGKGTQAGMVKVKENIAGMVTFQRLNLMESFSFAEGFDVIFCRNVMIYFDSPTRESLVAKYYQAIKPGGYLIIGHSESLSGIQHAFKYVEPTIYRKS